MRQATQRSLAAGRPLGQALCRAASTDPFQEALDWHPALAVAKTDAQGRGLFAHSPLRQGQTVLVERVLLCSPDPAHAHAVRAHHHQCGRPCTGQLAGLPARATQRGRAHAYAEGSRSWLQVCQHCLTPCTPSSSGYCSAQCQLRACAAHPGVRARWCTGCAARAAKLHQPVCLCALQPARDAPPAQAQAGFTALHAWCQQQGQTLPLMAARAARTAVSSAQAAGEGIAGRTAAEQCIQAVPALQLPAGCTATADCVAGSSPQWSLWGACSAA